MKSQSCSYCAVSPFKAISRSVLACVRFKCHTTGHKLSLKMYQYDMLCSGASISTEVGHIFALIEGAVCRYIASRELCIHNARANTEDVPGASCLHG